MLSKNQISYIRSLHQKKFRKQEKTFLAEGTKLVIELSKSDFELKQVYATVEWLRQYGNTCPGAIAVTTEELSKISTLVTAPEVLALVTIPDYSYSADIIANEWAIALDGIRDPGNLGTIIRIADWFGIQHILCSADSAEIWNPKVVQASMGSITRVKSYEVNLEAEFNTLKNALPIYGAYMRGESIYETAFTSKGILLIGNESNGITESIDQFVNHRITIPSFASANGPESLNAGVATAVICSEIRRKVK
jgi:RNA methyltransferase, TrmH family